MPKLLIDPEIRDQLVNYLATRPYSEVAKGIAALMALPEIDESVGHSTDLTDVT